MEDTTMLHTLAQSDVVVISVEGDASISPFFFIIWFAVIALAIVGLWKVFQKAGQEGWKSIIPIYNTYVMFQIAGRPGWWFLLLLIPIVNFVVSIILALDMAKAFGKSGAFGFFGLWLFSFIGYLMLAFGDAEYQLNKNPVVASTE
jgi:uncharacterized membrane protein YhaH (DUF805 family)